MFALFCSNLFLNTKFRRITGLGTCTIFEKYKIHGIKIITKEACTLSMYLLVVFPPIYNSYTEP